MDEIRLQPEPVNEVLLRGVLLKAPEFSHENHGKRFDRLTLSVQRLSGTYDHLEILADQTLTEGLCLLDGPMLEVKGEIRSFNNLLYFIPTAIAALILHSKHHQLEWKAVWPAALCGCAIAAGFSLLAMGMDLTLLRRLFGIFLLVTGISELKKKPESSGKD